MRRIWQWFFGSGSAASTPSPPQMVYLDARRLHYTLDAGRVAIGLDARRLNYELDARKESNL